MTRRVGVQMLAAAVLLFGLCRTVPGQDLPLDRAFQDYWAAATADEIAGAAEAIAATDADFDAVRSRLEAGRPYRGDVPTGRHLLTRRNRDGTEHDYVVLIPSSYDPARRYPVRVYLHGGVMGAKRRDGTWWPNDGALGRVDSIAVFPASWEGSIWWQASQVENLRGVLNDLKRTYNLDDNRASLLGVSDGATGVYYHGFKATTPWASFLPFNGHPVVLGNPTSGVDGEMYVPNLTNKSFFVVNGVFDRLYPAESVARYMRLFVEAGVDLDFRPQDSGHDMTWWPRELASIDAFIQSTARDPLPDRLTWETERTDRFNRAHWLLISELGSVGGESDLQAFNTITPDVPLPPLGISMLGELTNRPGVLALDVAPNTVAYDAGMRAGDVFLEVNGIETVDLSMFRSALGRYRPGSTIPIVIEREGARQALT